MSFQSALLVMDLQTAIVSRLENGQSFVANVVKAIEKARKRNLPVIFVRVGFRKGAPEISDFNRFFSASKKLYSEIEPEDFMRFVPEIEPKEGDILITKRRISAFAGSDLEIVLRSLGIRHLILTGVSTSGVVLSTTREAADKDFQLTIISDCCADIDIEVHRVLTEKVFPRQAEVISLNDWN